MDILYILYIGRREQMSRDYGTENRNGCKWTKVYTCHLESYDFTSGLQVVMICHGSHFEFITKRHDLD